MHDRSTPPQAETLRRFCMVAASLTIGILIWVLLGDSDSLVAEEAPPAQTDADQVLVEVSGIPVTESEVRSLIADQLAALEAQRQSLMDAALKVRVRELIIEVAASEQGLSVSELVSQEVDDKLGLVAEADVNALYDREGLAVPKAQVEMELRRRLRMEAFIQELEIRPGV